MKVFFYSTHLNYSPHIETELELMQIHLDKNDEVYRFVCNGELSICDMNHKHDLLYCIKCRDVRKSGGELLSGKIKTIPISGKHKIIFPSELLSLKNPNDLKTIYYQNFDVGYAISSTLISFYRNDEFDIAPVKSIIDEYYHSTVSLYMSVIEQIQKNKPDKIYIFNGRFTHTRAILRAAEFCGIDCIMHERGANKDKYDLFVNHMPHDKSYHIARMNTAWDDTNLSKLEKEKIAFDFFNTRRLGEQKDWLSFTKNQKPELLPIGFDKNKINIAIFNSSTDEFASISKDWSYGFFDTQEQFIQTLANRFEHKPNFHFYLRVHPNLKGLNNAQTQRIKKLNLKNLTVIEADSEVGSYTVLDKCNYTITFGSTMGIEAAYWGKPSILVANSFYNDESVYYASSFDDVEGIICKQMPPKSKLGSMKYGYYHATKGYYYKYYKADTLFIGKFKGVNIAPKKSRLYKFIERIYNIRLIGKPVAMYAQYYQKNKLTLPLK